jgi:hypothetical protein
LNGKTNNTIKSSSFLTQSEGNTFSLLGDDANAINTFRNLSETADRNIRPYFRTMYIYSILLKQVKGNKSEIHKAWGNLQNDDIEIIENALNSNIIQNPENIQSFRLWLKLVRYSSKTVNVEDVINKLKIWNNNVQNINNEVAILESAYYLYILYSILAIKSGETFNDDNVRESLKYLGMCKKYSHNDKYDFEWLGVNHGVKALVHHTKKGVFPLLEVKGTISNIYSNQNGKIKLEYGLEAFFVPYIGGFIQGKDETTEVKFNIGFRHTGLRAWNVQRINTPKNNTPTSNKEPIIKEEEPIIQKIENIEEEAKNTTVNQEGIFRTRKQLKGLTIVGKIDLSQFEKNKD